jgi:lysophospholipase L1-like esterase
MEKEEKYFLFDWRHTKIIAVVCVAIFLSFISLEAFLRIRHGFCDAVLMQESADYEYIAQPNQDRTRFGNRIFYNTHSMRTQELRNDSLRILCIGDSILNGGTLTDHKDLATTLLSEELSAATGRDIQVLNVSAGSWGPDNCYAWLRKHGDFNASALVFITSSHDARDQMTFAPVVGRLKYFPDRQYFLAIIELIDRYLYPEGSYFTKTKDQADDDFRKRHHIEASADEFNPGFQKLLEYAQQNDLPFLMLLHAELDEYNQQRYNQNGQEILRFCQENHIHVIQNLKNGLSPAWYRKNDIIHLSAYGQRKMADLLYPVLLDVIKRTGAAGESTTIK